MTKIKNPKRDDVGRIVKNIPDPINKPKVTRFELDSIMTDDPCGEFENYLSEDDEWQNTENGITQDAAENLWNQTGLEIKRGKHI